MDTRQEEARASRKSEATVSFYRSKAGHWKRVLEVTDAGVFQPFALSQLRAHHVDYFISKRRAEGARDNTIDKELTTLRQALKLAKRAGLWKGDVGAILPIGFAPHYKPRDRALTYAEAERLLAELPADRAAHVAFILATSANRSESERSCRGDVAQDLSSVLIRGTKNAARHRRVPIVSRDQRWHLEYAMCHAAGTGDRLFRPWLNDRRDLRSACESAGIPPVTSNDLRRTCATWLRARGAPPHLIAPVMGHVDSRMVERVYGRLPFEQLAARLSEELGANSASRTRTTADAPEANTGSVPADAGGIGRARASSG
ncbi:MAG: integrase family protein [Myxococcaceae bacterium]|nr:integrase family protein [Myxococcaceae bacterium]